MKRMHLLPLTDNELTFVSVAVKNAIEEAELRRGPGLTSEQVLDVIAKVNAGQARESECFARMLADGFDKVSIAQRFRTLLRAAAEQLAHEITEPKP